MSFKNRLAFKSALAALLLATLTPLTAAAQAVEESDDMKNNVGQDICCSEASEAEQYWTPERMENAKPLPMMRPGSPPKPESQPAPPSSPEVSAPGRSSEEMPQLGTEERRK